MTVQGEKIHRWNIRVQDNTCRWNWICDRGGTSSQRKCAALLKTDTGEIGNIYNIYKISIPNSHHMQEAT